jgi:hypothetical protein
MDVLACELRFMCVVYNILFRFFFFFFFFFGSLFVEFLAGVRMGGLCSDDEFFEFPPRAMLP